MQRGGISDLSVDTFNDVDLPFDWPPRTRTSGPKRRPGPTPAWHVLQVNHNHGFRERWDRLDPDAPPAAVRDSAA